MAILDNVLVLIQALTTIIKEQNQRIENLESVLKKIAFFDKDYLAVLKEKLKNEQVK